MSSSDLPACPACGSIEVRAIQKLPEKAGAGEALETFYACAGCGRDQTEAWRAVQPAKKPRPKRLIGPAPKPADPMKLGVGATL